MLNNLDFLDIDNCIIDANPTVKDDYVSRLKNLGLSIDYDLTVSDYDNSFLLIRNKIYSIKDLKDSLNLLRMNKLARNRFVIFEISPKNNIAYIVKCIFIALLLRRNPLLFFKHKSQDVVINLLPDSPRVVIGCSGFESFLKYFRYLARNIMYVYTCESIIIEY